MSPNMLQNLSLEKFQSMYLNPTTLSVAINIVFFLVLAVVLKYSRDSKITILFELCYEKMYDFFIDILWKESKLWVLTYVIALFFLILFFNLQSVAVEFLAPIVGISPEGTFLIEHYIVPASSDINFNVAMSLVSIGILIFVQFSSLWIKNFFKTYVPVTGNNYLTVERGNKNIFLYVLNYIPVKIFDIVISMFLGFLELLWLIAKIASLSFRLFWNMTSGAVLLAMSVVALSNTTNTWFGFSFPVWLPVLIYMQELLIGWIQALVFALLVAIFIKVSTEA